MEEVHKKREQDRQADMTVRISRIEAEEKKEDPVGPGMIGGWFNCKQIFDFVLILKKNYSSATIDVQTNDAANDSSAPGSQNATSGTTSSTEAVVTTASTRHEDGNENASRATSR
jgi:hypothetical protein